MVSAFFSKKKEKIFPHIFPQNSTLQKSKRIYKNGKLYHENHFRCVFDNTEDCCNSAFRVSGSLPLVQLKFSLNVFCSRPVTSDLLNGLATSIPFHNIKCRDKQVVFKVIYLFQKTFMAPVTLIPVASPVSKPLMYLANVLRPPYAMCRNILTVRFQYNFRQTTASFSAGRR